MISTTKSIFAKIKKKRRKTKVKCLYSLRGLTLPPSLVTPIADWVCSESCPVGPAEGDSRGGGIRAREAREMEKDNRRWRERPFEVRWIESGFQFCMGVEVVAQNRPRRFLTLGECGTLTSLRGGPQEEPVSGWGQWVWFYTCPFKLQVGNPEKWTHPARVLAFSSRTLIRALCGDMGGDYQWETVGSDREKSGVAWVQPRDTPCKRCLEVVETMNGPKVVGREPERRPFQAKWAWVNKHRNWE